VQSELFQVRKLGGIVPFAHSSNRKEQQAETLQGPSLDKVQE
jgi:hypothetical protein